MVGSGRNHRAKNRADGFICVLVYVGDANCHQDRQWQGACPLFNRSANVSTSGSRIEYMKNMNNFYVLCHHHTVHCSCLYRRFVTNEEPRVWWHQSWQTEVSPGPASAVCRPLSLFRNVPPPILAPSCTLSHPLAPSSSKWHRLS